MLNLVERFSVDTSNILTNATQKVESLIQAYEASQGVPFQISGERCVCAILSLSFWLVLTLVALCCFSLAILTTWRSKRDKARVWKPTSPSWQQMCCCLWSLALTGRWFHAKSTQFLKGWLANLSLLLLSLCVLLTSTSLSHTLKNTHTHTHTHKHNSFHFTQHIHIHTYSQHPFTH